MKCPKCGAENPEDSMFCQECGAKLENSMASTEHLSWLKWLGVIAIAIGVVIGIRSMSGWWYEGEFGFDLSYWNIWTAYVLPVIATFFVGGYSVYKLFDKKMALVDKRSSFKRLFIGSTVLFAVLWFLTIVSDMIAGFAGDIDWLCFVLLQFFYEGYGVVYIGVVCLHVWLEKSVNK